MAPSTHFYLQLRRQAATRCNRQGCLLPKGLHRARQGGGGGGRERGAGDLGQFHPQPWARSRAGQGRGEKGALAADGRLSRSHRASGWLRAHLLLQERDEVETVIADGVWISGHRVPDPPWDRVTVFLSVPARDRRDWRRRPSLFRSPFLHKHATPSCASFSRGEPKHVYRRRRG